MSEKNQLNHQHDNTFEETNVYGTRHGSTEYPLASYDNYRRCNKGDVILDAHWHHEYEILIVTQGEISVNIDNSVYKLKEGQFVFIASRQLHSCIALCENECAYTSVVFDISLLVNLSHDIDQTTYFSPLLCKEISLPTVLEEQNTYNEIIYNHVTSIASLYAKSNSTFTLQIKGHLYFIFAILFEYSVKSSPLTQSQIRNISQVKNVLRYIDEHIYEPLSTDSLSQVLCVSNEHFCRLFKKTTGRTPVDYINNKKMIKAAELLQVGDKKIIEVAFLLGYNNLSHFNRLFKRYMKKLPKEYKPK